MEKPLLSLVLAFAGYSLQHIGLAGQKLALALAARDRARGAALWVMSTAGMTAAILLVLWAVSLGNAALVGVMAGTGLASLAVFSHFVMRERIGRREIAGVAVIVAAALLIGAFRAAQPQSALRPENLYVYMGVVTAAYSLAWAALGRSRHLAGLIIAGMAGAIGGFIPLLQKLATTPQALAQALVHVAAPAGGAAPGAAAAALAALTNPWALGWIAASVLSMLVMQFAHRRDRAVRLVPAFAANSIAVPVLGAVIVFGTRLHPLQWLGIALIAAGVLALTWKTAPQPDRAPAAP